MMLFRYPKVNNGFCRLDKIVVNYRFVARLLIIEISKPERIAERVDFILALPNPRVVERNIIGVTVTVFLNVERIGIRVNSYIGKLTDNETSYYRTDLGVVLGQRKIMSDLCGGVSEPHCGNIARIKEG